jgi:hypothetical protein
VWKAIAERGRFGETEDDVLRRQFNLPSASGPTGAATTASGLIGSTGRRGRGNRRFATHVMTVQAENGRLTVGFQSGPRQVWELPVDKADKAAIRQVRNAALAFALSNGASHGQRNAVMKALSDAGYHVAGPKPKVEIGQFVGEELSRGVPIEQIRANLTRVTEGHRSAQYVNRTYRKLETEHGLQPGSLGSFGEDASDASTDATL